MHKTTPIPTLRPRAIVAARRTRLDAQDSSRAVIERGDGTTRYVGPARPTPWGAWCRTDTVVEHDPWAVFQVSLTVVGVDDVSDSHRNSGGYDERCHHCRLAALHSDRAHADEISDAIAFERRSAHKPLR